MTDAPLRAPSAAAVAAAATRTGLLDNGVRWAMWPDARDVVVATQIWVRTGSAYEDPGRTGLAHMLEHMMFRGTERVPDGQFDAQMDAIGASVNAMTWLDYTAYTTTSAASWLPEVLALEADRFGPPNWTPDVFVAERSVVANERRQTIESSPEERISEALYGRALGNSPYRWPTIGTTEHIEAYTAEAAMAFHLAHYAPGNLYVTLCGAIDPGSAERALRKTFGTLPVRGVPTPPSAGPHGEAFELTLELPVRTDRLVMAWPGPARGDADFAAWAVTDEILAGGDAARLPRRLEVRDGIALSTDASLGHHRLPGLYEIHVTLRRGQRPATARRAVTEELRHLADDGPSASELQRAIMAVRTRDALALAAPATRAEWLGESAVVLGDPFAALALGEQMAQVRVEDVAAIARRLVDATQRYEIVAEATR